jgi:PST family polysaccharide transporter
VNKLEEFLNKNIYRHIFKRQEAQHVANNTVWIILDRMIRLGLGMITGIWVARYLGPSLFGQLTFANTFCVLFTPISTLSIEALIVRDLGMHPERKNTILGTTFALRIMSSIVAFALSMIIISFLKGSDSEMFLMVFILSSCFIFQSLDVIDLFFQSTLKSKYSMYVRTFVFISLSLVKLVMIYLKAPLIAFAWAYAIEISLGSIGLAVVYILRKEKIVLWNPDWVLAKTLLKSSVITMMQTFALVSQTKVDQIILGQYLGNEELGQYSVAMRMIDILSFLPMAIYASYAPKLAESMHRGGGVYMSKLANFYRIMFYLAIVVAIPCFFIGKPIIAFAFGSQYLFAGVLFSLSGIRVLAANMIVAKSTYFVNENMLRHSLYCLLAGAITSVGLNIWLIPIFNSYGAILANIGGFFAGFFIVDLFNSKTRANLKFIGKSILFIK